MGWLGVVGIVVGAFLLLVALYDVLQRGNPVLRNFPVVGHIRFWLITIGPELRQYIVAANREERPFNRSEREWIYRSADLANNYFGFGTDDQIYSTGYPIIKQATFAHGEDAFTGSHSDKEKSVPCAKVVGESHGRAMPYRPPSIVNISAMSFGSLGAHAIAALNKGAALASCFHNTGEGGVSAHHRLGGDLCYQLGTGYFGARDADGNFDISKVVQLCEELPQIRMIELKISQGAKPGKGGVLPGTKVTEEIGRTRGIPVGKDCISPNNHTAFRDVDGLIALVEEIAEKTGRPVGIKSAIGQLGFWYELAERMRETKQGPDFIAIDGGEGGTGAAPLAFSDHVSLPYKIGFSRVFKIFQAQALDDDVVWIGSGKLGFADRAIIAVALGADLIAVAREAMMSIGCIQAQKCHTGHCPTGVATHSWWLQRGLDPEINARRFRNYVVTLRNEIDAITHAAGYHHPGQFTPHDVEISSGPNQFRSLYEVFGYDKRQYAPGREAAFKAPDGARHRVATS